jgi:hypothetical protein
MFAPFSTYDKSIVSGTILQKPVLLTTFSRSNGINNIYLNINDITPARDGQNIPAKSGHGHRLLQFQSNWLYIGKSSRFNINTRV